MRFYYLFLLLLINQVVRAQTNSVFVKNIDNYYYCGGQELQVNFTTIGDFGASNQFKVQISDKSGDNFTDIGVSGKSSPITCIIPENLVASKIYRVRVVATNPSVVGVPSNYFEIMQKPKAIISAKDLKYPVNINEAIYLNVELSGGSYYDITLNDNTTYSFYEQGVQNITKYPYEPFTYKIVKVTNQCGVGEGLGSAEAKINQFGLKILSLNDSYYFCAGGKISLSYTANDKFNADNKFKLNITTPTASYEKTIDIAPETNIENLLSGILPANLAEGQTYIVRLQTTSPALSSNTASFTISPKIFARVGAILDYETPYVSADVNGGVPPYTLSYSDGTVYSGPGRLNIPIQTNSYKKLKLSLSDQCGNIPLENDSAVVSGNNYMALDSLPTRVFCKPDKIELGFKSNLTFTNNTKFLVRFHKVYAGFSSPLVYDAEAKLEGEKLVFNTPTEAVGFFRVEVEVSYPFFTSNYAPGEIELSRAPDTRIYIRNEDNSGATLDFNGVLNPTKAILKIDDYELHLEKRDFKYDEYNYTYVFALNSSKSSKYTVSSLANGCGVSNKVVTASRTISNPQSRIIQIGDISKSDYCSEEEITVPFKLIGELAPDEEVELYIMAKDYTEREVKLGSSKTGSVKAKLNPYSSGNVRIILKISNTNVKSESRGIRIAYPPNVSLSASNYYGPKALKGQRIPLTLSASGILPINFNLNGKNYTIKEPFLETGYYNYQFTTYIFPTESQEFKITNARNEACGAGQIFTSNTTIEVVPIRVFFDEYNAPFNSVICTNKPLTIGFKVFRATKDTRYVAQISDKEGKNFKDITIIKNGNPITVQLPKGLVGDYYKMRLGAVVDGQTYYSEERSIRTADLGVATLTAADGSDKIQTSYNAGANLKINFTGSLYWTYFIPGVTKDYPASGYDSQINFSVTTEKTTTYKLLEVVNACGYNERKGEVKVSIKPEARISNINPQKVCTGQPAELSIQLVGDFVGNEEITFLLTMDGRSFVEVGKIKLPLTSNKLSITIPKNQKDGYYYIYSKIGNQEPIRASDFYVPFSVASAPSLTIAGSSIINTGSSTLINLSAEGTLPIDYELTDGTKGTLSYNKNSIVSVTPSVSTTYTLKSVFNTCGAGTVSGQAKITVNPPAERSVSTVNNFNSSICTDQSVSINFQTQGSFSANNKFQVQLSDANGENFKNIAGAEGLKSPITFKIPSDIQGGKNYRFRVVATDPNTAAEANISSTEIGQKATAKLSSIKTTLQNLNESVSVKLDLTGSAPWNVELSDSLRRIFAQTINITETPYTFTYFPKQLYTLKLNTLYNVCGLGTIVGEQYLKIQLITASEATEDWTSSIYPNPTSDFLYIKHNGINKGHITVTDISGKAILIEDITNGKQSTMLKVGNLTTGVYLISIEGDNKRKVWKMIKE